jgi:p-hydroxybenzoate 3-monooxygenase
MTRDTGVVVVGAGPAGLTLACLLQRSNVDCVVLEARSRAYVERRQRAGMLDHAAGQIFLEYGLADRVLSDARRETHLELRYEGAPRLVDVPGLAEGRARWLVPQQMLLRRLIAVFLDGGGDLRFDVSDVGLHDLLGPEPTVTYTDGAGTHRQVRSRYIAGCDGYHGVSRAAVPPDALTTYSFDHGIRWITFLAEVPPPRHSLLGVSRHGFAAQFARGPATSRFYLQHRSSDDPLQWPDERVWHQLRLRFGDPELPDGPITARGAVDMRSFVTDPMSYGQLHLVGDAAHIITPVGAKGMNLAIADAHVLARAITAAEHHGDPGPLRAYSDDCLRRTWNYQEFSRWLAETVHFAADHTIDPFRRQLAKARLDRLFTSRTAATAFADLMAGTPTDADPLARADLATAG